MNIIIMEFVKDLEIDGGDASDTETEETSSVGSAVKYTGGADDSDQEEIEIDEEDEEDDADDNESVSVKENEIFGENEGEMEDEDDEDDDDDDNDEIFEKINETAKRDIIQEHHPELKTLNYEEVDALCTIVRDSLGNIIDPFHKTLPILSRYEKARILGERAEQINSGAQPFIEVEDTMIDGYLIAMKELEQKKIPFIIQRPLPNGGCEYWRLSDLEVIQ